MAAGRGQEADLAGQGVGPRTAETKSTLEKVTGDSGPNICKGETVGGEGGTREDPEDGQLKRGPLGGQSFL